MLNKNCKILIASLVEDLPHEPTQGYTLRDLNALADIKRKGINDIFRIAEEMVEEKYLIVDRSGPKISGIFINSHYWLSEKGVSYRIITKKKVLRYLADKWIDILALVVAAIALAISILAYIQAMK